MQNKERREIEFGRPVPSKALLVAVTLIVISGLCIITLLISRINDSEANASAARMNEEWLSELQAAAAELSQARALKSLSEQFEASTQSQLLNAERAVRHAATEGERLLALEDLRLMREKIRAEEEENQTRIKAAEENWREVTAKWRKRLSERTN